MDYLSNIYIFRDVAVNSLNEKLINCISCGCQLKYTNSGGPLLQNNKIIGMLIRGLIHFGKYHEGIFIKASYIRQTIERYTR